MASRVVFTCDRCGREVEGDLIKNGANGPYYDHHDELHDFSVDGVYFVRATITIRGSKGPHLCKGCRGEILTKGSQGVADRIREVICPI